MRRRLTIPSSIAEAAGHLASKPRRKPANRAAQDLLTWQLRNAFQVAGLVEQFRFPQRAHPGNARRVWIADLAVPARRLMVEMDGGIWISGAHAHPVDIERNMRKQNDAVFLGYRVLRYTPDQVRSGEAASDVVRFLELDARAVA